MKEIQLNGLLILVDDGNAQGYPWVESAKSTHAHFPTQAHQLKYDLNPPNY